MLKQYSEKEILEILGERMRVYRSNLSMTQEELAIKTGLSLSTIQKTETGKANISIVNFLLISRYLGFIDNFENLIPEQPINPYLTNAKKNK